MPATVTSPRDIAAAKESPARRPEDGGVGWLEADEPMYVMKGRPWRSIAACIFRRPRSLSRMPTPRVLRRVIVAVWVIESPVASAMRTASALGTFSVAEPDAAAPDVPQMSRRSIMSWAGVRPARVDPPPARP